MVVTSPEQPLPEAALLAETAWLRRLARHMVGEEEADDVVQDACVKALERPPRDPSRLRGWLARVVRNAARGRLRDRLRRLRREEKAARGEAVPENDVVSRAETQQRVVNAVMGLEEPYRTTILLRFFDDLPPRKVAARMGVPVATVHTRLRRGLDQLRRRLGERGRSWALVLLPLLPREGGLGSLVAAGGALMSKKAALAGAAAVLALSLGGVVWLSRVREPDRSRELALAPRGGGGEEAPEPGGGAVAVEGRVRLRGRVVDADGHPVPGARVDLVSGRADPAAFGTFISRMGPRILDAVRTAAQAGPESAYTSPPVSRATAVCDAEGGFDLAGDPRPGDYVLVRAPGFAVLSEHGLSLLRPAMGVEFQLRTQLACRFRVVDDRGAPVRGAQVSLVAGCLLARAETDADGRADFRHEARGDVVLVAHGDRTATLGSLRQSKEEEIRIEIGESSKPRLIEGTVRRASDRAPVPGAAVYFDFGAGLATTDAQGRFVLPCVEDKWSPRRALVADAGPAGGTSIPIADLPPNPLDIVLHPTRTLEGKLEGSVPLEGLRVFALQPGLPWREGRADASGAFRIEGTAADAPVRVLFDPWDALYEEKGAPPYEITYEPWPGYATLGIVAKAAFEGRVVDENGAGIAGARIEMRPAQRFADGIGAWPMCAGVEHTDDEGRFRIDRVTTRPPPSRPGVLYLPTVIRVSAPGFVWRDEGPLAFEPGEERKGVVVRLERGLSITGRVVTEDGSALPKLKVRVYERGAKSDDDGHSGWALVDGVGRYRIDALPPGNYGVYVSADEFQPVQHDSVPAGSEASALVLRRGATIEGIVVDEAGRPMSGVHVTARRPRIDRFSSERTDTEGRFRIRQLEPGAYDVQAGQHGYLWENKLGVAAPSSDVRFVLRRGLSIKGRVVRADGTPILNVTVRAERIRWAADLPGSAGQASTDKDGSFEITGVSEGEFRLTFEGATETVLPPLDQVTAGSEILVQGEAGRFIGGKVVDREGQPARGRVVAVPLDPDGYAARDAYAAEDGTFRVGPLKGSRFALVGGSASKYGFALDVEAGATDVPLVLGKGDVLAGRIVDKDGKLSAGNLALFHEKLAHTWQAWTEDGQFRMEGLPPGTYFAYATPRNQYVVAPTRGGPGRSWTRIESGTTDATLTIR